MANTLETNLLCTYLVIVIIRLFLFFHLSHHVLHHMIRSQSHSALLLNASWLLYVAVQDLTYNACRTFWNYLHKDSMECLIANTYSPTSIYSQ